jgi:predicted ribosomally synthesized peptide with nif11-like leader
VSEEQLSAFLAAVTEDAELQEKLKGAADLDAAVAMAQEAGFDISKADWLRHQAKKTLELSDAELERVAGAREACTGLNTTCNTDNLTGTSWFGCGSDLCCNW